MRRGFSVQIIEDEAHDSTALRRWLTQHGYPLVPCPFVARPSEVDAPGIDPSGGDHAGAGSRAAGSPADPPPAVAPSVLVRLLPVDEATPLSDLRARLATPVGTTGDDAASMRVWTTAAVRAAGSESDCSRATAIGCDDVLTFPAADTLITHQLDRLHALARLRQEIALRQKVGEAWRSAQPSGVRSPSTPEHTAGERGAGVDPGNRTRAADGGGGSSVEQEMRAGRPAPPDPARRARDPVVGRTLRPVAARRAVSLKVLIVGPPAQAKVRLAESVGQASVSFVENAAGAARMTSHEAFDLVVLCLSSAGALDDCGGWSSSSSGNGPHGLVLYDPSVVGDEAALAWSRERGLDDCLSTALSVERLRIRLEHWRQMSLGRRRLTDMTGTTAPPEAREPATGLVTQDYLSAYGAISFASRGGVLGGVIVQCTDLFAVSQADGFAATTDLLHRLAHHIRAAVRVIDVAGYCGNGRFAVLAEADDREDLERIRERIVEACAPVLRVDGTPPALASASALLRRGDDVARFLVTSGLHRCERRRRAAITTTAGFARTAELAAPDADGTEPVRSAATIDDATDRRPELVSSGDTCDLGP
ncbi:MAG: hypothetical protein KDE35_13435 [Geminicoccaceae bacterium]|nr:hypothetical protein [Geminicoccaceae bacterium]